MYIQVNESMFHDQFFAHDRQDNFSYSARSMLFDYLTEAEDNGDNSESGLELDIIGICCDFAESTVDQFINDYSMPIKKNTSESLKKEAVQEYISDHSIFIGWSSDDSFVYAQF